ncbi:MAG: AbrB/MazE/SpoVT family DNA-binding domain-containing protein [Defluviitaleaceae bacterium]|nr:AbrB/MazE/SpoVT family DNA-binding domain-containing protein [Defluviitaleaceae bacterium]
MITTIQKWGNSQGVRLPKVFLDELNMREGNEVEILKQDNIIVIKSTAPKRKTIQELFADYDGDYTPEDIDWGPPAGDEIW